MKISHSKNREMLTDANNASMCDICNERCPYDDITSDEITPQELCIAMKDLGLH